MVYASVRRPDVLMHGGHHTLSEQDLLNLHNAQALSALEDGQVSIYPDYLNRQPYSLHNDHGVSSPDS